MTANSLIAPSKLSFNGAFVKAEVFTKFGWQARTVNAPLSSYRFREIMDALPFAYYLDNRQLDDSYIALKEIQFNYEAKTKKQLGDVDVYESASRYDKGSLEIVVSSVSLKYSIGDEDDPGSQFAISSYNISISFEDVSDYIYSYWEDLIKEWDEQLLKETNQLSLFDVGSQAKDQIREAETTEVDAIRKLSLDEVNLEDYEFKTEDLQSKSGKLLTGDALRQRQLKLINNGQAKFIGED
jgi:hypothetical protein